jgi:nitrous oxidase accessory protein NosD
MKRILGSLAVGLLMLAWTAASLAATIHVPADQPTLAAALAAAAPGDAILMAPGTYPLPASLGITKANLTIQGSGIGSTVLQTNSGVGDALVVSATGFTLRDLTLQKTDLPNQHLIAIYASSCTIRDNEIYGPDPGTPWSVNGIVSRAMVVAGGLTGLSIQGNQIHHLRQPAYISAPTTGSIVANNVSGTRGWVVEGATLTFSGNTFGPPEDQGADIALLSMCNPADYPDLLALSAANGNAYISGQFPGAASGRAHAYVDVAAAPGGTGSAAAPVQSVQVGVNGTLPGGVTQVAAGTYTEQVVVDGRNLTLQGAGRAATIIRSPATLAVSFATPGVKKPVLLAQNAADVRVRDLTVDGAGQGNTNNAFLGVAFFNAGGKLLDCDVTRVRDTPLSGAQHGVAVYAYNTTGGPFALEVGGVHVTDFQKGAGVLAGNGLTVDVHDCTFTGAGPTGVTAQNGLQVSSGAMGTARDCAFSGVEYTGSGWTASGVLVFGPAALNLAGTNSVAGCQTGLYYQDASGAISGTSVSGSTWGAVLYNTSATAAMSAHPARTEGSIMPLPAEAFEVAQQGTAAPRFGTLATSLSLSLSGGCLLGADAAGSAGIYAWSAGGGLNVGLSGMELKDWDEAVVCDGPAVQLTASHSAFTSNLTAALDNTLSGSPQVASYNWWGAAGGPSGGDAVLGTGVTYAPWLVTGADANPGCGFSAGPDNVVSAGPAPSCLSQANTCITVPVTIAHTTSESLRGFTVTLQLSSNLVLCGAGITEGSYLNSIGGTAFQVVDNGGGSYTVDGAILGLPCGATAPAGTIFLLHLAKAPLASDGTGTVTLGTMEARDCDNATVALNAGAPLSITIDGTSPAAVANLAAAQKKTGNDGDGTTKIQLTFTAPPSAAVVEVYRAPYGQYPEYDDAGGAAPAAPAYPPAAPWTLTAVTASLQYDEPATRDFWYYVVFTKDACGNVSAVSNRTNGTLDYHLGDVSNGYVAGAGNNSVGTEDISLLGAHYGITLGSTDPLAYLDVGPTTDRSVNARPTTDNKVNFEDLMMFAINHGQVSAPQDAVVARAVGSNSITLDVPATPAVGELLIVPVRMMGAGNVQGASLTLGFDPAVVEQVAVDAGELLSMQGRTAMALSSGPGNLDFALLGTGQGVSGEGDVARVAFRVKAAGAPGIVLRDVQARDAANNPVAMGGLPVGPGGMPARTSLGLAAPNPFTGTTSMQLALAGDAQVKVCVFDLLGRRVRTLVDAMMPAGQQVVVWDGRDDSGLRLAPGLYVMRLDGAGVQQSRRVMLVK